MKSVQSLQERWALPLMHIGGPLHCVVLQCCQYCYIPGRIHSPDRSRFW